MFLYNLVGPLLNPALALGQCLPSLDFNYPIQYILMPFVGSALALIFYDQVFVRSQEFMMEDDDEEDEGLGLPITDEDAHKSDDEQAEDL